jgi:uncharacterized protein (DUF433 family)
MSKAIEAIYRNGHIELPPGVQLPENTPVTVIVPERQAQAWYHNHIERREDTCGGYPVIKGTRTPVRAIIESSQTLSVEQILQGLPHLTREQVEAAIVYYAHEPALVDEDIRRNQDALNELMSQPWPVSE